ncbi:MAG: PP2C family protein-serine/threonine phosphatase [Ignavibacteria bacterium]|nr:PP2C family protein-serine/threonine phosphatase [Ignavibacteria bacterium]
MEQRKLYKTLDNIIKEAPNYEKNEELLLYVLEQIIKTETTEIIGGRLWQLNDTKTGYVLIEQVGDMDPIEKNYEILVANYPKFKEVGAHRSVMAKETDPYLVEKGILTFSATGVGERYKIKKSDEIFYLYQYLIAFNAKNLHDNLTNTLNIISTTLSYLLRSRKIEDKVREDREELEKAREIQKNILPDHEQKFGNYEIFGISLPDKIVGGDFFDYLSQEGADRLGVVIGDAASKGFSAAAQALYVSGAVKMGVEYSIKMSTMIGKINNLVYETFPFERFVTLFYCELYEDKKGLCMFVNAGHNSPLFYNSSKGEILSLDATGSVLGISPNQKYFSDSINLDMDDFLVMFTDGIVEATDENFNFFGEDRLREQMMLHKDKSAKEICENILEYVQKFSAKATYSDDKTMVVIRRIK